MLKSNFEKHLDQTCESHQATWSLHRGVLTIRRPGFKSLEFKAWGHDAGVDLESDKDLIELRWVPGDSGLDTLGARIRGMRQERWQVCEETLKLAAVKEQYPAGIDWKEGLKPELRDFLECFPECESGEGVMAPCPSFWLACAELGWASMPQIVLNRNHLWHYANVFGRARESFLASLPLGLPLPEPSALPEAAIWERSQMWLLGRWLDEDVTRYPLVWNRVKADMLLGAINKMTKAKVGELVELLKKINESEPTAYQKMVPKILNLS